MAKIIFGICNNYLKLFDWLFIIFLYSNSKYIIFANACIQWIADRKKTDKLFILS